MREKYESLALLQLRELAKVRGLKGTSTMKKAELIDILCAENEKDKTSEAKGSEDAQEGAKEEPREKKAEKAAERGADKRTDGANERDSLDSGNIANGILEVMADGYGFIRCENYLPGENDVYVAPSQIRRFNLKTGDIIVGNIRIKTQNEKFSALLYVKTINGLHPNEIEDRMNFENMTPIFPNERIRLETGDGNLAMRIMDIISPVGKGQRGMIVSPPKAGKTTIIKEIGNAIRKNHPDIKLGSSPRGSISLYALSKAYALARGRNYVIPDDVKYLAPFVLGHRIMLTHTAKTEKKNPADIIKNILSTIVVPIN